MSCLFVHQRHGGPDGDVVPADDAEQGAVCLYIRDMADRMGTSFLQMTLNKELSRHIQQTLPTIRNSLRTRMLEIKKELGQIEDVSSPAAMRNVLMK